MENLVVVMVMMMLVVLLVGKEGGMVPKGPDIKLLDWNKLSSQQFQMWAIC